MKNVLDNVNEADENWNASRSFRIHVILYQKII